MFKRTSLLTGFIVLISLCSYSIAAQGARGNLLERFFSKVRTYQADFSQVVLDAEGNVIQESSGKLWIKRPQKFRWEYKAPYKQKIIGDGKKVWIYDPELLQVSVRAYDKNINQTPAVLLASNKKLSDSFIVTKLGAKKNITWLGLKPKGSQGSFSEIRIGFKNKKLSVLELIDSFGQTTRITLSKTKENVTVKNKLFNFIPPKGVDVVGQ